MAWSDGALVAANGLVRPDFIYAGQRLIVPGAGQVAVRRPVTVPGVHVVQPGETLYSIAVRYGTTVGALVTANNLTSANMIFAGQRLVLPGPRGIGQPEVPGPAPAPGGYGRRVVVDLSSQTVTAYDGASAVASFPASTGHSWTPTPVGRFRIYSRYRSQRMIGPGYNLPNVPYVQYFVGNYALHGAYWHNQFGTPTSHGCVNLRVGDAAWLWNWAGIGTEVIVQW
jgi:lipoprotein-anchoring transpeptidase ErfK/SrfK